MHAQRQQRRVGVRGIRVHIRVRIDVRHGGEHDVRVRAFALLALQSMMMLEPPHPRRTAVRQAARHPKLVAQMARERSQAAPAARDAAGCCRRADIQARRRLAWKCPVMLVRRRPAHARIHRVVKQVAVAIEVFDRAKGARGLQGRRSAGSWPVLVGRARLRGTARVGRYRRREDGWVEGRRGRRRDGVARVESQERGAVPKIHAEIFWRRREPQVGEGHQELRGAVSPVVVALALTKAAIRARTPL